MVEGAGLQMEQTSGSKGGRGAVEGTKAAAHSTAQDAAVGSCLCNNCSVSLQKKLHGLSF